MSKTQSTKIKTKLITNRRINKWMTKKGDGSGGGSDRASP